MSVLSHVEFPPQFTDDDEAEFEREEEEQQRKLKEYLDQELDDNDIFEVSFASYRSQGTQKRDVNGEFELNGNVADSSHSTHSHPVCSNSGMQNAPQNYPYSSECISSPSNNQKHDNTNDPSRRFYSISNHYAGDETFSNNIMPNEGIEGKQYLEDSQLHVLYNARGKKIKTLERQMEDQKESYSKEMRVLQHRLTMMTSEKDGLATSVQQQGNLLQEHKHQISGLETQLSNEQGEKHQIEIRLKELNEKLYASDCAVETLQQQIKQLNQTESMSRARAQHESMLASMRQRYEEENLTLKEKLDDLQQALAWKTEDLNRYREMLDSNSSVSEIGILRTRLAQEEKKTKDLNGQLEKNYRLYIESDEQLKLYEGLVKMQAAQLTSTPLNAIGVITNKDLDQTPLVTIPRSQEMKDSGVLGPNDSSFREELVKSLSSNREKRQQINVLRDQLEHFQKQYDGRKLCSCEDNNTQTEDQLNVQPCDQCLKLQREFDDKLKELENLSYTSKNEINQLQADNAELRANIADMVKNYDKQKIADMENQTKATLQLVDDAKANMLKDVQSVHDEEKQQLNNKIERLNGELLHTKEEYLKLCLEMKNLEEQMRKEFDVERGRELAELRQSLETEFNDGISKQEIKITNKYVVDLENERVKCREGIEKEVAERIDRSVMLAKADWIECYSSKRGDTHNEEENSELNTIKEKCGKLEKEIKQLEVKCCHQQEDFDNQLLEVAKTTVHKAEMTDNIDINYLRQKIMTEEKRKFEENLQDALADCNEKWETELKKVQTDLTDQMSLSRKVELDLKLKKALWNRTESEMKRKIESLQEIGDKDCEKCLQLAEYKDRNSTESNVMCDHCTIVFKNQENLWQSREQELLTLLENAQQQIKSRLGSLKNSGDTSDDNLPTSVNWVDLSEKEYKENIEKLNGELKHWKDLCLESEKRISELNSSIVSAKEDLVYAESCYERQRDSLQKQLAKKQDTLLKTEGNLSNEIEKTSKVVLELESVKANLFDIESKQSLLNSTQLLKDNKHADEFGKLMKEMAGWKQKYDELEKDYLNVKNQVMVSKCDKSSAENDYRKKFETLQGDIFNLKLTLSQRQNELENERKKNCELEVKMEKLCENSKMDYLENSIIGSKEKLAQIENEKNIDELTSECNKWKLKYHEAEKENVELERNLQLQLTDVTQTESFFKKQVETLQNEVANLTETLTKVQNDLFIEKERSMKLDLDCKQLTKNYNINLEKVLCGEKQKWQLEASKLQEAVLKASEIDHNNFVKEIQSQTNHVNEINKIKEDHDILVKNLKQGFREKLARITETKKRWIKEEEEKRSQMEKKIKEKYACKVNEIQEQQESMLRDQQAHWIKEIHRSKKEQLSTLVGLREEVKMKDKLLLKERKTFEDGDLSSKKKLKDMLSKHQQEMEGLEIGNLDNLQKEKRRLEQFYKIMNQNNSAIQKETSHRQRESAEKKLGAEKQELDCCGKTRQFYVETLERIQLDMMYHVETMRSNADIEIKEAVEKEKKKIFEELKTRESVITSSPKTDKAEEFGSPTLSNSMFNGSVMVFKELPHTS